MAEAKKIMTWSKMKDEYLCHEILLFEPYKHKTRTKERRNAIADSLNEVTDMNFKVDARPVRERFTLR